MTLGRWKWNGSRFISLLGRLGWKPCPHALCLSTGSLHWHDITARPSSLHVHLTPPSAPLTPEPDVCLTPWQRVPAAAPARHPHPEANMGSRSSSQVPAPAVGFQVLLAPPCFINASPYWCLTVACPEGFKFQHQTKAKILYLWFNWLPQLCKVKLIYNVFLWRNSNWYRIWCQEWYERNRILRMS